MSNKLKFTFLLFSILITKQKLNCQNLSSILCANSYDKLHRNYETVNCIFPFSEAKVNYECRILYGEKLQSKNTDDVIEAILTLNYLPQQNESIFYWKSVQEQHHTQPKQLKRRSTHDSNDIEVFKYNASVILTKDKNTSIARLVLYKIYHETLYKVCVGFPGLIESNKICCTVEKQEEEEESNIFMSLIVFGVLAIIYAVVVIVFWLCPPSEFHTIEDLLEKLPTGHVERLKNLVIDHDKDLEEMSDLGSDKDLQGPDRSKYARSRKNKSKKRSTKIRIDDNVVEIDNPAYVEEDDDFEGTQWDNHSGNGDDEHRDEIELNLYKEAQKLRRMSRVGVSQIKLQKNPNEIKGKQAVKFADIDFAVDGLTEMDNLKLKIFSESKRRASIKPFKRAYDLDLSDSE